VLRRGGGHGGLPVDRLPGRSEMSASSPEPVHAIVAYSEWPSPVRKAYRDLQEACKPRHELSSEATARLARALLAVAYLYDVPVESVMAFAAGVQK